MEEIFIKKLKKTVLPLSLIGMLTLGSTNVFANELSQNNNYYDKEIVSNTNLEKIENISKEEFYKLLRKNNFNLIEEKGYSKPSSKNIWNLEEEGNKKSGDYKIYAKTEGTTIYSNYMFIGHNAKVKFDLNE